MFLGFINYYQQFIYRYTQVSQPLYQLILGESTLKKHKALERDGECEEAFRKLKEICTSTPILLYVNFLKSFTLHTDGFTLGLGAILYQNQDRVD